MRKSILPAGFINYSKNTPQNQPQRYILHNMGSGLFRSWMVGSRLSRDAAEVSQFLREDTSVISLTYFPLLNSSDRVKIAYGLSFPYNLLC